MEAVLEEMDPKSKQVNKSSKRNENAPSEEENNEDPHESEKNVGFGSPFEEHLNRNKDWFEVNKRPDQYLNNCKNDSQDEKHWEVVDEKNYCVQAFGPSLTEEEWGKQEWEDV